MLFGKKREPDNGTDGTRESTVSPRRRRAWRLEHQLRIAKKETEVMEKAVDLAQERAELRDRVISLSYEDPQFLIILQDILDRMGL